MGGNNEAMHHIVYKFDGISNGDTNYDPQCNKKSKRTKVCYFLLSFIVIIALATITAGVVLLKCANENKDKESNSVELNNTVQQSSRGNLPRTIRDLDEYCEPSRESRRVNLQGFLKKCLDLYFKMKPNEEIVFHQYKSSQDVINKIARKFKPFVPTPRNLKRVSDQINELENELKSLRIDEEKLKPKENQILHEVKTFLLQEMSNDYEFGFYGGGWMFGPGHHCFSRICRVRKEIYDLTNLFRPRTESDVEWLLTTFLKYKEVFKQYERNLKLGIKSGMVKPYSACYLGMEEFRNQHHIIIENDPYKHSDVSTYIRRTALYSQLSKDTMGIWLKQFKQSLPESVYAAYIDGFENSLRAYYKYLSTEYIYNCPSDDLLKNGLSSLPVHYQYVRGKPILTMPTTRVLPLTGGKLDGKVLYGKILRKWVTLNVTADTLYENGKKQVEYFYEKIIQLAISITKTSNVTKALERIQKRLNESDQWHGTQANFSEIENSNAFHEKCWNEKSAKKYCPVRWRSMQKWKNYFDRVLAMIHPQLNNYFYFTGDKVSVPNCPVITKPHFAPALPLILTQSDSKCSEPAALNLPFFAKRYGPRYEEWSSIGRHVRPGYYFQIQGSVESFTSPCINSFHSFLREQTHFTGYIEGWGTYAENPLLSDDVKLYEKNQLQKLGMYQGQMLRAIRLLIDTRMNYYTSSHEGNRAWATKKLRKYTMLSEESIKHEINKVLSVPGLGTAQMIGRTEIMTTRMKAEKELGIKFNIKDFHYQILSLGIVPLEYLKKHLDRWVKCVKDPKRTFCEYILTPVRSIPKTSCKRNT